MQVQAEKLKRQQKSFCSLMDAQGRTEMADMPSLVARSVGSICTSPPRNRVLGQLQCCSFSGALWLCASASGYCLKLRLPEASVEMELAGFEQWSLSSIRKPGQVEGLRAACRLAQWLLLLLAPISPAPIYQTLFFFPEYHWVSRPCASLWG